jgi:hypothetical protein
MRKSVSSRVIRIGVRVEDIRISGVGIRSRLMGE